MKSQPKLIWAAPDTALSTPAPLAPPPYTGADMEPVTARLPVTVPPVFRRYLLPCVSTYCFVAAPRGSTGSPARISGPVNVPPANGNNPVDVTSDEIVVAGTHCLESPSKYQMYS